MNQPTRDSYPLTVLDVVKGHGMLRGYDGLFNTDGECGCLFTDIAPCGQIGHECQFGYRHNVIDPEQGECWEIHGTKQITSITQTDGREKEG